MKNLILIIILIQFPFVLIGQTILDETGNAFLRNSQSATTWNGTTLLTLSATAAQTSGFKLSYEADSIPRVGRLTLNNNWDGVYGDLAFSLRNSSGIFERMRITSDGKVGIGTRSPSFFLDIDTGSDRDGLLVNSCLGGSNLDPQIKFIFTDAAVSESGVSFNKKNGGSDFDLMNGFYNGNQVFVLKNTGNIAIQGTLEAKEIKVLSAPTADFVFNENYDLKQISELESYINEHKHLPGFPSGKEVNENGVNLGEMDAKLLQKIEELTLYMINLNKEVENLKEKNKKLEEKLSGKE